MVTKQPNIDPKISEEASNVIKNLLINSPKSRLCSTRGILELKEMTYFKDTQWDGLFKKEIPMPFSPKVSSSTDVSSFETLFTNEVPVDSVSEKTKEKSVGDKKGFFGGIFGFGSSGKKVTQNTNENAADLNNSFAGFSFTRQEHL